MAQAGLGFGAGRPQAGLTTMGDRYRAIDAMRARGATDEEIGAFLNAPMPETTPADTDGTGDDYGFLDKLEYTARQAAGMPVEGVGKRLGIDWLADVGEAIGPGEDLQEARAEARAERAQAVEDGEMTKAGELARNVGDSIVESSGSLGGGILSAAGAGAVGGAVGGPLGAAVGAALGAAAYGVTSMYGEAYQSAEDNGLDTSDPNVRAHIDAAALAGGALDAIPSFRILRKVDPGLSDEIIKKTAGKGLARAAGKEGAKEFASEGVTEVSQEALQAVLLDPDVVASLTMKEKMELAPEILRQNGPQFLEAFLAGGVLGGGAGAMSGAIGVRRARQKEARDTAQAKEDLTALGKLAEERGISEDVLTKVAEDPEQKKVLMEDMDSLRKLTAKSDDSISMLAQAEQNEAPEADIDHLKKEVAKNQRAVVAKRDEISTKHGGVTQAKAEELKKADEDRRKGAATQRIKDVGLSVTEDVAADIIETQADAIEEKRNATAKARARLERATDANRSKRTKQYRKAVEEEADALDGAAVELEGRTKGEVKETRLADVQSEVKAAEREGAVGRFMERDWADVETMSPEERLEKAQKIIPSKAKQTERQKEVKDEISKLKREQDRVTSPAEYDTKQRRIDALQASLSTNTPRVEAAERVARGAREEIKQAEEQAATEQPTTSEATTGEPAGSAETQAEPTGTVEGDGAPVAGKPPETEAAQPSTATVDARKVQPETRRQLAETRKTFRKAPTDAKALKALEDAGRQALGEAGITNPTPEQLGEAIRGGGSVAERIVRASRMPMAEVQAPVSPKPEAGSVEGEAPSASPEAAPEAAGYKPLVTRDDGQDVDRNHKWRSLRGETDTTLPIEEQEEWMRQRTANDPKNAEIAATYAPDGTMNGIGSNGHFNAVTAPAFGWGEGGTYTHSHPFKTPFSPGDLLMLVAGKFGILRAVLPDQTIEIRPGQNIADLPSFTNYWGVVQRIVDADPSLAGLDNVGFARIAQEVYLQSLAADGYIEYSQPMTGFTANERTKHREHVNAVLADPSRAGPLPVYGSGASATGQGGGRTGTDGTGQSVAAGQAARSLPDPAEVRKTLEASWKAEARDKYVTYEDLLPAAELNQETLGRIGRRVGADLDVEFKNPGVKKPKRSKEKMAQKGINAGELTDVVRGGFMAKDAGQAGQIANALTQQVIENDAEILDEGLNVTDAGYFDQKMLIRFPNGQIAEIQIWEPHLFLAKEGRDPATMDEVEGFTPGHTLYEEQRELPPQTERTPEQEARYQELNNQMRELYASAATLAHPSFQLRVAESDPSLLAASGNRLRQLLSDIVPADASANMDLGTGFQSPRTRQNVEPSGNSTTGSVSENPNTTGTSPSAGAATIPAAEGVANPDIRQRTRLKSSDPEKVGEIGTAMHQRLSTQKGRKALVVDVREGAITPEGITQAIAEVADHANMTTSDAVDAVVAKLYPQYVEHTDGNMTEFVPEVDKQALDEMRARALQFINELSVQLGAPITTKRSTSRNAAGRTVSTTAVQIPPKAMKALGAEPDTRDGSAFTAPGDFDPDETEGIKLRASNVMEGPALEAAKLAARFAQRNEYRLIPANARKLTFEAFMPRKMQGLTEEQRIERFGKAQKFAVQRAEAKLKRFRKAMRKHGDRPIAFRWRIDDKGRMYADGEFTPQVSESIKYLFEGDGMPLADMLEIDHTGSGWQIAAFLAKDHVLAPVVNIHGGQQGVDSPTRGDIYTSTNEQLESKIRADAASGNENAQRALQYIIDTDKFRDRDGKARNAIKPAVIAVNYGGGPKNFRDALGSPDSPDSLYEELAPLRDENGNYPDGFWQYVDNAGFAAVEAAGPHTAAMKNWIQNALKAAIGYAKDNGLADNLSWTVGRDGTYSKLKYLDVGDEFDVYDNTKGAPIKRVGRYSGQKRQGNEIDVGGTARTIFSQIIQGYDAAILHDALSKMPQEMFITPNHDSYTTARENAVAISDQVNQSMLDLMGDTDLTQRIMQEIDAQLGLDNVQQWISENPRKNLNAIEPFTDFGQYDQQEITTAIPMYAEGGGLQGKVSPFHLDQIPTAGGFEEGVRAQDFLSDFDVDPDMQARSTIDLIYAGKPTPDLATNKEAAEFLQALTPEGEQITDFKRRLTPAQRTSIAKLMAAEAAAAIAFRGEGSAADWYTSAMSRAMEIAAIKYPMMKSDAAAQEVGFNSAEDARFTFLYAMATTSQNLDVRANAIAAIKAYDQFLGNVANGDFTFGEDVGTGSKKPAMQANFDKFELLFNSKPLQKFSPADRVSAMRLLFDEKKPLKEWQAQFKKAGVEGFTVGQTAANVEVYGSAFLGPKIGNGFYQNLAGNYSPITIDLWARRMWGRMTGKNIGMEAAFEAQRRRLASSAKRSFRSAGDADLLGALKDVRKEAMAAKRRASANLKKIENSKERKGITAAKKAVTTANKQVTAINERIADIANERIPEPWLPEYDTDRDAYLEYAKRMKNRWDRMFKTLQEKGLTKDQLDASQPTWAKAAKATTSSQTTPLDQVQNATQRKDIEATMQEAIEILEASGIVVSPADLQAILWYPEKDLWGSLSSEQEYDADGDPIVATSDLNESYDTVLADILEGEGHDLESQDRNASGRSTTRRAGSEPTGSDAGRSGRSGPDSGRSSDATPIAEGIALGRETYPESWLNERGVSDITMEQATELANRASEISGVPITGISEAQGGWADPAQPGGVSTEPSTVIDLDAATPDDTRRFAAVLGHMAGQHSVLATDTNTDDPNATVITIRTQADPNEVFSAVNAVDPDAFGGFSATEDGLMLTVLGDDSPGLMQRMMEAIGGYDAAVEIESGQAAFVGADTEQTSEGGQGYAASLGNVGIGQAPAEAILRDARRQAEEVFDAPIARGFTPRDLGPYNFPRATRARRGAGYDYSSPRGLGQAEPQQRQASPLLDELPNVRNYTQSQRRDFMERMGEALRSGAVDHFDLKRIGMTGEAITRLQTEAMGPVPVAAGMANLDAPEGIQIAPETKSTMAAVKEVARDPATHARTWIQKLEDGMFNRFAPIRRLEEMVKGALGIGAESAYKAAETAVNDSGRNEALMYYGAAKLGKHGEFTVADGTSGIHQIFTTASGGKKGKEAGQTMADWMGWMAAKRIQELQKKRPDMKFPMKDLDAALAKEQPQFQKAADMWRDHNNANIDFLVDTGRISKKQADAMKEDQHYVPFYRSDAKMDGSSPEFDFPAGFERKFGGKSGTLLDRNPGIHKIVGGDKMMIDNIMKNMIRNSQAMVAAGMRNKAANQIFELMGEAGLASTIKGRKKGKNGNYIDVAKPSEHAVKLWIDGKMKWALPVPGAEPYLVAMAGLQPQQLKGIMGLMANVGSIFRQGITLSPAFMVRNLIRGMVANGLLTSGANLTLANNTMTGLRDAYNNGAATQAFKAASGMGDFRFGGKDVGFGQDDILIEFGLAPKTWGSRIRKAIDKAEHVGSATELADRVAAMNTMIARGMRPDEAAYQARAVMDYARHGGWPWLRAWLPLVPFFNARLQGLSRMTEGAVGRRGATGRKQAAMQLALNGAILSAISTAIWAMNGMDEEDEERYKSEPLHRRLNYHIIYAGDKAIYIPKAFELGHLFSSIPELFLDAATRDMNEIGPGVKKILADTLGFQFIPAAMMPIIEGQANYSFFREGPIESRREQDLEERDRVTGAGSLARFVGQQMGVSDLTGVSPTMIQHYLEGFGGAYFHTLSGAIDMAAGEMGLGSAPVGGAWGDVPVASRMMERVTGSMFRNTDQQSTKYMEEFYRNKDYITQIHRSAKDAAARGDVEYAQKLLDRAGGTQQAYKVVNKAASQLGDINRAIRDVRADTKMSPKQKRDAIEPLIRARNNYVRAVANVIKGIEEAQGITFKKAS